jgi:hypothetical protein
MTDKIDELMAIIANEVAAAEYGAFDRIRKALETALKPGELNKDKARKVAQCAFAIFPHVKGKFPAEQALNELVGCTAPPAQTPVPPRLTTETFKELAERCDEGQEGAEYVVAYGRDVEKLVRKQAGWE